MGDVARITLDAETFKALASTTRLSVLRALDERRKTLSELARDLDLNKATLHEHLGLLSAAGLVRKRDDEGRKWIYYELTWTGSRILHPQETTTFNVLLGLSVAAAGGGMVMLTRALGLWATQRLTEVQSGDAMPPHRLAAPYAAAGNGTGPTLATSGTFDSGQPSPSAAAPAAEPDTSGSASPGAASPEPAGGAPPPSSGPSAAAGSEPSGSAAGGAGGAGGDGTPDMGAASQAPSGSPERASLDSNGKSTLYDASHPSPSTAADHHTAPDFWDDGGLIALALIVVTLIVAVLAVRLGRKVRPKPFDAAAAKAAEGAEGNVARDEGRDARPRRDG